MGRKAIDETTLTDLLYQALETEQGGIEIYETAIACAVNDGLRDEWQGYLDETRHHEALLLGVFDRCGLDPERRPPSREVVAGIGKALVAAMQRAQRELSPEQAELVACECVVLAETKDHSNWELLAHAAKEARGEIASALGEPTETVTEEEAHHLFHTRGWCRELWIKSLGLPAVLPPPEEKKHVETAIGASRAEQARSDYL